MRKSIIFGLFLLAISLPVRADKVPQEKAAAVAERYLGPATKAAGGAVRLVGTWPQAQTKSASQDPALYLFERDGGGYAVVAADDVSLPVIGYSKSGSLTKADLPCNLRFILDWHASIIDYARTAGLQATDEILAEWSSVRVNDDPGVKLETARWDQSGHPWNDMIPKLNGRECPVGCVATAQAIILRYHEWPEKGTGTLPSYYWYSAGQQMQGHELGHTYDWSQMPLDYVPGKYTDEQAHQMAQLQYDLAIMSQMDFHPAGSGATGDMPLLLAQYFGYDKQIKYQDWDYYTREAWEETIRAELDAYRPVFYGASNKNNEGHAFVLDGYQGPYFSINYGWTGAFNDYYLLRPSVSLPDAKVTEFCDWACMVTNIYPDRGGEVSVTFSDDAIVPFPWDYRSKSFPLGGRELNAQSSGEAEATLGFVLFNRNGKFKATTTEPVVVSSTEPYMPELTCNITCDIEDGDCIKIARLKDDVWTPIDQTASAYMTFHTGKKLSDLVSLDYSLGDVDYPTSTSKKPRLYITGVKEVYWEMWSEDYNELLATSQTSFSIKKIDGKDFNEKIRWDKKTNQYRFVFLYPSGNYRLMLRHFDEEVTLYVKL